MKNMYAISIGLTVAGTGCLLIERIDSAGLGYPSFELTGMGCLLAIGGLMLLVVCLVASADDYLKRQWRRGLRCISGLRRRWRRSSSTTTESC
ncbi:hypothetical protein [Mitsuaria sp. GD03876]|uniref:hypothetical protein n=1 Tax=Mitsuaria sp. GD03876 TaxID=2975399 RepID=UPI00244D4929|nr:hypothetical protein [Mitsuaria sp. GD03876]MDH0865899.1 hypothetical protein [Mitsuaria sp. GD03876]